MSVRSSRSMPPKPAGEAHRVLVVGGGGAGLAAAIGAAQAGARVTLLEQAKHLGGTTRMAVGSITAAGTRLQAQHGITDDVEAFRHDMDEFTADLLPHDNAQLRALLAREAGRTVDWLEALGVVFFFFFAEPPHRVPRMHNAVPGASTVIRRLERQARTLGVDVICNVHEVRLWRESSGLSGLEYQHASSPGPVRLAGPVILATGDFSGNTLWRTRWLPETAAKARPINPANLGFGHELAFAEGAYGLNMSMIFGPQLRFPRSPHPGWLDRLPDWPWLMRLGARFLERAPSWALRRLAKPLLIANMSPAPELFAAGARLVDANGCQLTAAAAADAVAHSPGNQAFILLNQELAARFSRPPYAVSTAPGIAYAYIPDYLRGRPDIAFRVSNQAALAARLGLAPSALAESLQGWEDEPIIVLGPVHAMLTTTEGSLAVDDQLRVLSSDGSPITGLFAAGCVGQGGLLLRGHGLHWAWTFTSGRLAGHHAACLTMQT